MSEAFTGEIRMFAGNFAPRGYALCDGQLIAVSQNDALFSLFGTFYGGDGRTTFGLPDLRGRIPEHYGQGAGLSNRPLGQKAGQENVTLTAAQMPTHRHQWKATNAPGNIGSPAGALLAQGQSDVYIDNIDDSGNLNSNQAVTRTGGSQQHTNLMPFLCINFIVCLVGIYPSRQ